MKQLQTGNGTELHLVKFHETFYPYRIEQFLHTHFKNKHELGEWFNLDIADISNFDELCLKYESIINAMKDNPFFKKTLH